MDHGPLGRRDGVGRQQLLDGASKELRCIPRLRQRPGLAAFKLRDARPIQDVEGFCQLRLRESLSLSPRLDRRPETNIDIRPLTGAVTMRNIWNMNDDVFQRMTGRIVRAFRMGRGEKQGTLAIVLGIGRAHISLIESGERALSLAQAAALARHFGCKVDDLSPPRVAHDEDSSSRKEAG